MNEKPIPTPTPTASISVAEIIAKSPDPVGAIRALGTMIAKSQMLGPCDREEIGQVCVMVCATENLTVGELFRTYQLSFGKLEKRIHAAMAEFRRAGGTVTWVHDGSDGQQAEAQFTLNGETITARCTAEEARKAGWMKNSKWTTEPMVMLRARVTKRGILALAPGIFYGESDPDEYASVALDQRPPAAATVEAVASAARPANTVASASAPTPTPTPAPAGVPAPAPQASSTTAPRSASAAVLSHDLQEQLVALIRPERLPHAQAWLASVSWLAPGQSIEELPEKYARQIIAKADAFSGKLDAFIAAQGGAK